MNCPVCGGVNEEKNVYCIHCGANLEVIPSSVDVSDKKPISGTSHQPMLSEDVISRKRSIRIPVILGILGLLLVCVITISFVLAFLQPDWFTFSLPIAFGRGDRILLGLPSRSGVVDLHVVRLGKEASRDTLIAENITEAKGLYFRLHNDQYQRLEGISYQYGAFFQGTHDLFIWYLEDDEIVLLRLAAKDDEPKLIFDTKSSEFIAVLFDKGQRILITEPRDNQRRCYVSHFGGEAERMGKGNYCGLSRDGSTVLISERTSDGLELTVMDIDGINEVAFVDEEEGGMLAWPSGDGSRIAFVRYENGMIKIVLLDSSNGEVIAESDEAVSLVSFPDSQKNGKFYFIVEDKNGELELFTLDDSGSHLVATSATLAANFSFDGTKLIYLVAEGDEEAVYVHTMLGEEDIEVVHGEDLAYSMMASPDLILIKDEHNGELRFYSAGVNGEGLIELFSDDDTSLVDSLYVSGENTLYLKLRDDEGLNSLFVTPTDRAGGFYVIEEWAELELLNRSTDGKWLVFSGREDDKDDLALFSVETRGGTRAIELDDDAKQFVNAAFTNNSAEILFTAVTGDDPNDIEVRKVRTDGEARYEMIYDEAFLVGVQWDLLEPFGPYSWKVGFSSTSFCPGASTILVGETVDGTIAKDARDCYRFRAEDPIVYTFLVESLADMDLRLDSYDQKGNYLWGDDNSGLGYDPLLRVSIDEAGFYYVTVRGQNGTEVGGYTIQMLEGEIVETSVQASESWQDTGIIVGAGDLLSITYSSGSWTWSTVARPQLFGPEGDPLDKRTCGEVCDDVAPGAPKAGKHCPLYDTHIGALIGRVGDDIFFVGESTVYTVPTYLNYRQHLFLRMNDCETGLHDNGGSIWVRIGISK